jgi:hypothetical protein
VTGAAAPPRLEEARRTAECQRAADAEGCGARERSPSADDLCARRWHVPFALRWRATSAGLSRGDWIAAAAVCRRRVLSGLLLHAPPRAGSAHRRYRVLLKHDVRLRAATGASYLELGTTVAAAADTGLIRRGAQFHLRNAKARSSSRTALSRSNCVCFENLWPSSGFVRNGT